MYTPSPDMNPLFRTPSAVVVLLAVAAVVTPSIVDAQTVRCRAEIIPGALWVRAINDRGEVVGDRFAGTGNHAFKYSAGRVEDLGTFGGPHSQAMDINDRGDVVGNAVTGSGYLHAFLYSKGEMRDLGTLDPSEPSAWSIAFALNSRGTIVGQGATGSTARAFSFDGNRITDLGTLGGTWSGAFGINDSNRIVGVSALPGDIGYHATVWENGGLVDLGTLGGNLSWAFDINGRGEIVGKSTTATGEWHTFIYRDGRMDDLGSTAEGTAVSEAINARGWVVGESQVGPSVNQFTPFLFTGKARLDLSSCASPEVEIFLALDVNSAGAIAAVGGIDGAPAGLVLRLDGSHRP
jgi:probable HAF family extracellular repeat protein